MTAMMSHLGHKIAYVVRMADRSKYPALFGGGRGRWGVAWQNANDSCRVTSGGSRRAVTPAVHGATATGEYRVLENGAGLLHLLGSRDDS